MKMHRMVMFVASALVVSACAASDDSGGTTLTDGGGDTHALDASAVDGAVDASAVDATDATDATDTATTSDGATDGGPDAVSDTSADTTADAAPDAAKDVSSDAAPVTAVRVEEIYVDRDISGDAVEYVELRGPVGTSLETLHLRLVDSTGKVTGEVAISGAGAIIPASGLWVVGGASVSKIFTAPHVDETVGISKWGLDNTAGSVQLVDVGATTTLLDVLGWGAAIPAPTTAPKATSEAAPRPLPTAVGHTLGRRPGAADSNDNTADFCEQNGTPGATNGACL